MDEEPEREWHTGLCDCFEDASTCKNEPQSFHPSFHLASLLPPALRVAGAAGVCPSCDAVKPRWQTPHRKASGPGHSTNNLTAVRPQSWPTFTTLVSAPPCAVFFRLLRVLVLPVSRLHRLIPVRGEHVPAAVRPLQPGSDLGPGDPADGRLARAAVTPGLHEAQVQNQGTATRKKTQTQVLGFVSFNYRFATPPPQGTLCQDIAVSCFCVWCGWCQLHRELKNMRKPPVVINMVNIQPAPVMQHMPVIMTPAYPVHSMDFWQPAAGTPARDTDQVQVSMTCKRLSIQKRCHVRLNIYRRKLCRSL